MNLDSLEPDNTKSFEGVPFSRILFGAFGHALLNTIVSIFLYLIAGLLGVVISWFWGISIRRRSIMQGFPKATGAMGSLATPMHLAIVCWAFYFFELSFLPPWWP